MDMSKIRFMAIPSYIVGASLCGRPKYPKAVVITKVESCANRAATE